jgi:hypothetical protein
MPSNCFICLDKAKNKICNRCECYAHLKCWGKYINKESETITFVSTNNDVLITSPMYTRCPQCRENIKEVKSTTRSDTYSGRRFVFMFSCKGMLVELENAQTRNDKIKITTRIFKYLLVNKNLFNKEDGFKDAIRDKLKFFYYNENWKPANMFHRRLFGKPIAVK